MGLNTTIAKLKKPPSLAKFLPLISLGYFLKFAKEIIAKTPPMMLRNSNRGEYQLSSPRIPKTKLRTADLDKLV
jgi:hypothetical protein